ncbi:mitochondrial transcription rescue factor 1 [Aplochiton taeniatus]
MQTLLIQALTLRQLGKLNPRQLLTTGHGLNWTEWCPRTIHTRQVWGSSAFLKLGTKPMYRGEMVNTLSVHQLRFNSSKKKQGSKQSKQVQEDEEEDSEESDYEDEDKDDFNVPKDFKDLEKYVQSFRFDVIMKAGLDIARNKIEDAFYSNKLRLNGQKLIKKSKSVTVGDTLDIVLSENRETNTVILMRVILRKILGESNDGDKYKVSLRRWKNVELSKEEAFKP